MDDDLIDPLATACVCGPLDADGACLPCCARTEIQRLREQVQYLNDVIAMLLEEARRG